MKNMNYQKYLIKVQYPLLIQLQWHAEMFYIGNCVAIVNLWNTIQVFIFFKVNKKTVNTGLVEKHIFLHFLKRYFVPCFTSLFQILSTEKLFVFCKRICLICFTPFKNLNKPNCICSLFTYSNCTNTAWYQEVICYRVAINSQWEGQ